MTAIQDILKLNLRFTAIDINTVNNQYICYENHYLREGIHKFDYADMEACYPGFRAAYYALQVSGRTVNSIADGIRHYYDQSIVDDHRIITLTAVLANRDWVAITPAVKHASEAPMVKDRIGSYWPMTWKLWEANIEGFNEKYHILAAICSSPEDLAEEVKQLQSSQRAQTMQAHEGLVLPDDTAFSSGTTPTC